MQIVPQSATLKWITPNAMQEIESAGRVCYKSEAKITTESAESFIRGIIYRGHESVLEHASASFHLVCDRGISHELVRHRIASFSQESTRYCDYGKAGEISVIVPPQLGEAYESLGYNAWAAAVRQAESSYEQMRAQGLAPQIARSVLPTCLKTEIRMTANFREWRLILSQRLSPKAHPQMRELMRLVADVLVCECPICFEDVIAQTRL